MSIATGFLHFCITSVFVYFRPVAIFAVFTAVLSIPFARSVSEKRPTKYPLASNVLQFSVNHVLSPSSISCFLDIISMEIYRSRKNDISDTVSHDSFRTCHMDNSILT